MSPCRRRRQFGWRCCGWRRRRCRRVVHGFSGRCTGTSGTVWRTETRRDERSGCPVGGQGRKKNRPAKPRRPPGKSRARCRLPTCSPQLERRNPPAQQQPGQQQPAQLNLPRQPLRPNPRRPSPRRLRKRNPRPLPKLNPVARRTRPVSWRRRAAPPSPVRSPRLKRPHEVKPQSPGPSPLSRS